MRRAFGLFVLALLGACGDKAPAPPPPGAALAIDGEIVTLAEIDEQAASLTAWRPALGDETARSTALEAGLLPRAIARKSFPEGVVRAREAAATAMSMLRERKPFEEVQALLSQSPAPKAPLTVLRREIDPLLSAAVFGRPSGFVTPQPVETTFGVVIARVDLPLPEAGPQQDAIILSTIEFHYDPSLADATSRLLMFRDRMGRARYDELTPGALRWLPPWIRSELNAKNSR